MHDDLEKLGTVLAVSNQINRDMLNMLKEQQRRQVRMIWASLVIVLVAFVIVGVSMFCAFHSFNQLNQQLNQQLNGGMRYGQQTETSAGLLK